MVLNKKVIDIKKDFAILVGFGFPRLLSQDEDALMMEKIDEAIWHKIQTIIELPSSSVLPMVDDVECEIYSLSQLYYHLGAISSKWGVISFKEVFLSWTKHIGRSETLFYQLM